MTDIVPRALPYSRLLPSVFGAAIFTSAALVFTVEPMVAKMILPLLGGSPAVWNVCMAFFQAALLAGYLYAHLLQRLKQVRTQLLIHLGVLGVAAFFLPIGVTGFVGSPAVGAPIAWLLSVLVLSVGLPFAALSSTAPLLQAWYAKALDGAPEAQNPYILYGASNLGSLLALLAYPVVIEPLLALPEQTLLWAFVYTAFCALIATTGAYVWHARNTGAVRMAIDAPSSFAITWRRRVSWVLLAAAPSSLMLGATTYISNDVASVPLFWVVPLALYLLTFVIAFQVRPVIDRERALLWQMVFVALAAAVLCINTTSLVAHFMLYLGAFFFSALVCHHRLAADRPHPTDLTEFYLLISLGGVLGGMFNAFLAPVLFRSVLEFPLVLTLCCLARPWLRPMFGRWTILLMVAGIGCALANVFVPAGPGLMFVPVVLALLGGGAAILVGNRAVAFTLVVGALCAQAVLVPADKRVTLSTARSFFGVHRVTLDSEPALGGTLHLLFNGTTIHGAQPEADAFRCQALTYYAPIGPLGQVYASLMTANPAANVGVVGLGAGTLATYTVPGSRMRYFEIDPEVERIARDPRYFTYLSECAKGAVDVILGDARITVADEPAHSYDMIQIDAFSADNIPTHLLTTEALEIYFRALKPDGILMLHLSNRNLKLEPPAAAAAKEIGATALMQEFAPPPGTPPIAAAPSQVMLMSKSPTALAAYANDKRWRPAHDEGARAWTDDYTNILGPLIEHAIDSFR